MGLSASIITSEFVCSKELGEFCFSIGGWLVEGGGGGRYGVNNGDTNVWLAIQSEWMTEMLYDQDFDNACAKILCAPPKVVIEMECGRGSKQDSLYVYVAYMFSKKWNIVLCDIDERILSPAEIEARCAAECGDLLSGS
ncbi:hypothetical protein IEQ11_01255 [Lysobacter capsici]|uniref:hypothetical protein n=1 Tax=Lysobacter capsici TaxID=435897 RepID=UPI0017819E9C|nr:hypothetical protein [Lysobacter capsici]UOF15323.1 hypothetical protein IEQ11_01255 [Lysobacter capsici]